MRRNNEYKTIIYRINQYQLNPDASYGEHSIQFECLDKKAKNSFNIKVSLKKKNKSF